MIKIYKNDNDELECHVKYAGFDFKFQCIRDFYGATYEGSDSEECLSFERSSDSNYELVNNLQDVMYDIVSVDNWRDNFEEDEYKQKIISISNQYSTEIEQALNNKDLNESLFLLEKIKMDIDEVLKDEAKQ